MLSRHPSASSPFSSHLSKTRSENHKIFNRLIVNLIRSNVGLQTNVRFQTNITHSLILLASFISLSKIQISVSISFAILVRSLCDPFFDPLNSLPCSLKPCSSSLILNRSFAFRNPSITTLNELFDFGDLVSVEIGPAQSKRLGIGQNVPPKAYGVHAYRRQLPTLRVCSLVLY